MLTFAPHPILEVPSEEYLSRLDPESEEDFKEFCDLHRRYHEALELSRDDPYRHGFVLPSWDELKTDFEDADAVWVFGGNRSSKSTASAKLVVDALVNNPGTLIFCWSQNDELSKLNQQPYIYDALPAEFRKKQRDEVAKVVYSRANGFTDKNFILPNGSRCIFKTYTQFANDPTVIEGVELGYKSLDGSAPVAVNIGNWFDEYLGDGTLLETVKYRLLTRNAKNLITFTPIDGYTETVRSVLEGATTLESKPAELLDGEVVPILQRAAARNTLIRYFHTADNPFNDWERTKRELGGKSKDEIRVRAYGVPTKAATSKFPKFQRHVNVLDDELMPKSGVSRYHLIDPAGRKNWFMLWIAVDAFGDWYVYREWPSMDEYGPWAEFGRPLGMRSGNSKWRPGPAQKALGMGITEYRDLVLGLEGKIRSGDEWVTMDDTEVIYERGIDPRLSAATYSGEVGQRTMLNDLDDAGLICIPAPGDKIEGGLQMLTSQMAYDDRKPIDSMNKPRFYISSRCENTILAIENYTGDDGKDEAWKDPIDCLRYAAVMEIDHVGEGGMEVTRQGGGGY